VGLIFTELTEWRRWQDSRRRLQVLKGRLTSRDRSSLSPRPGMRFWTRGRDANLLVACDSSSPTNYHSLLTPLNAEIELPALIAAPRGIELGLPEGEWREVDDPSLRSVSTVATIGAHLTVGAWAHAEATRRGWREVVVQHGLLTPYSPPPPHGVVWLAWSEQDAEFIATNRPDLRTHVTGSAMLHSVKSNPAHHVSRFVTPIFLGQLHGAELSRWSMARSVTAFWRQTGAIYRPHPREEDRVSRAHHALWRRMGMEFDFSRSVGDVPRPVVSAFSTGIMEAAAHGIPAWVYHLAPPPWLEEVWSRYDMRAWGEPPTSSPDLAGAPSTILGMMLD